jgi:hypothetical protein
LQERFGAELVNLPPVARVVLSMWLDEYHWWEIAVEIGATEDDARAIHELTCDELREAMNKAASQSEDPCPVSTS